MAVKAWRFDDIVVCDAGPGRAIPARSEARVARKQIVFTDDFGYAWSLLSCEIKKLATLNSVEAYN